MKELFLTVLALRYIYDILFVTYGINILINFG